MKTPKIKSKARYVFGNPPPEVGEPVWAKIARNRVVRGILVRRTKKQVVIHPEGGVDITIERPVKQ